LRKTEVSAKCFTSFSQPGNHVQALAFVKTPVSLQYKDLQFDILLTEKFDQVCS